MKFEEISIIIRIVYLEVEGVQLDEQCRCSRSISGIQPVDYCSVVEHFHHNYMSISVTDSSDHCQSSPNKKADRAI